MASAPLRFSPADKMADAPSRLRKPLPAAAEPKGKVSHKKKHRKRLSAEAPPISHNSPISPASAQAPAAQPQVKPEKKPEKKSGKKESSWPPKQRME